MTWDDRHDANSSANADRRRKKAAFGPAWKVLTFGEAIRVIAEDMVRFSANATKLVIVAWLVRDNNAPDGGGEGWANGRGGDDKDGKESDGGIHCLSQNHGRGAGFVFELKEKDWPEVEA